MLIIQTRTSEDPHIVYTKS